MTARFGDRPCLVVSAASRRCAIPLADVEETMRPLPCRPVSGAPPFVLGVAIVRGAPIAVVDLARVLGETGRPPTRFVSVRTGSRVVALAVEAVLGVRGLGAELAAVPPLLGDANAELIERIGALDGELLALLRASKLLTEDVT